MGARGPAPEPTAMKKLRGNPGGRPLPKNEPHPKVVDPRPPSSINGDAKRSWRQIATALRGLRVITVADLQLLELTACAVAEYRKLRRTIDREGHTYETFSDKGMRRVYVRPEVALAQDAWRRAKQGLEAFGLSPSSRTRVQSLPDGSESTDPAFELLHGKRPKVGQ